MKKWIAGQLVRIADRIHDTTHYCAYSRDGVNILMACNAYGHGFSYATGVDLEHIEEFDDIETAFDWMDSK
jgi:hypothetical protein